MKTRYVFLVALLLLMASNFLGFSWNGKKTLKELVTKAPCIVIGRVVDVTYRSEEYLGQDDFIFTYVTLSVQTFFKGDTTAKMLALKIPGGQIGERVIGGERSFRFVKDEEALLFLKQIDNNYYEIYSISGKLPIVNNNSAKFIDCSLLQDDEVAKYNYGASEKAEDIIDKINIYLSRKGGK
jgi:hypothetical protein